VELVFQLSCCVLDLAASHRSWQLTSAFKTQALGTSGRLAILRNVEVLLGALNKARGLTKEKKAMMFKVDEDRAELFQNILPQYAVYPLVQAVRNVSNTIHHKHLSLGP
jgi:hypothetical protein